MRLLFLIIFWPSMLISQLAPSYSFSLDGHIEDGSTNRKHGEAHEISFGKGCTGMPNSCVVFTSENQYFTLPVHVLSSPRGMTVSFWVYAENKKKASLLIVQRETLKSPGWQISIKPFISGKSIPSWDFHGSGFWDENLHSRGYPARKWSKTFEKWHLISMTYCPGEKVQYYLNGILIHESRSLKGMKSFETNAPIIVGNYPAHKPEKTHEIFKGKVDNIKIFDSALNPKQIEEIYFEEASNFRKAWTLTDKYFREKMRSQTYIKNRKQGKSVNYCYYNNAHRLTISDNAISQLIGERIFNDSLVSQSYDEKTQSLTVVFPDFDTISFNNITPDDLCEPGKMEDSLSFIYPKFEVLKSDSIHLSYLEMHLMHSGKRYVSKSRLSYIPVRQVKFKLEQLAPNLDLGIPLRKNLNIILPNIYFETGKDSLLPTSFRSLNEVVTFLNKYPKLSLDIAGHTDNQGEFQKNLSLSSARAKAVRAYLIAKGIATNRLSFGGYGPSLPIASNDTREGRKQNRRVEIRILE